MKSRLLSRSRVAAALWLALVAFAAPTPHAQGANSAKVDSICTAFLTQTKFPQTLAMVNMLAEFAEKHHLPTKIVELGPPERRVKRLIVGLNFHDWDVMVDYMKTFNLEGAGDSRLGGVIALEYQAELGRGEKEYVGAALRPRPSQDSPIWAYGREDVTRETWWNRSVMFDEMKAKNPPIVGFAHLIGMDAEEQKNVWYYLYNPAERAVCKSSNCVAWQTMIETGKTGKNVSDDDRKFLASELGFARSIEHIEISRRMMHYSNERHAAVVAFLNGDEGVKAFEHIEDHLPPLPKKSAREAVRGVKFSENAQLTEAIKIIPDVPGGAKVFIPIAAGASSEAVAELAARALETKDGIDVHVLVNGISERTFEEGVSRGSGKFRLHALFLGGNLRTLYSKGKVHHIPGNLADFARHMRGGDPAFKYDAIVVRVSPPNSHGHYSLGPNYDFIKTVIESHPGVKVIAEVNPNIPFTHGENFLKKDQIDAIFYSEEKLNGPAALPVTPVEEHIGNSLAELIPNGATVQIGIGTAFGGLPAALVKKGRKGLKISTEMFGDDLMKIVESKVAVSAETGFAYGTENLYRWLDHNEKVVFKPTEFVNDPSRIAATENFHALNTAIQVDLHGQTNATMGPASRGRISSIGGQVEFLSGASRSKGGKGIVAIRSTALQGKVSAISLDLYPGPITTPQEYVTHVVTEYGIAKLVGQSDRDRAIALINVAHPKFRKGLVDGALERKILFPEDESRIVYDVPEISAEKEGHAAIKEAPKAGVLKNDAGPGAKTAMIRTIRGQKLPAFLKKAGDHEIPVVLFDENAYESLHSEIENSIGFGIELETRPGIENDHGRIRVGGRVMDFGTPGLRPKIGDPNETGIMVRPLKSWLKKRQANFLKGGVPETHDGKPMRMIEVMYPVTPPQKAVAETYFRSRHGGLWRSDFYWTMGNQEGRPNLLCHPGGGAEHCFSFATGSQTQFHQWAIREQLYHGIGIRGDLDVWLKSAKVRRFQDEAKRRILESTYSDSDPETWKTLTIHTLADPELVEILKPVLPANLSEAQIRAVANLVFADKAIEDYRALIADLGVKEDHLLDFENPKASAVLVYEGPESKAAFEAGTYEYNGKVFGIANHGTQRPLE